MNSGSKLKIAQATRAMQRPPVPGKEESMGAHHAWPKEGTARTPYWISSDPEIYARNYRQVMEI
jgi:hypothetical protein